jgi:small-conductance mechanosensitive channel
MIKEFLDRTIWTIGMWNLSVGQVLAGILLILLVVMFLFLFSNSRAKSFFQRNEISASSQKKLKRYFLYLISSVLFFVIIKIYGFVYYLIEYNSLKISLSLVAKAVIIVQIARIADWIISNLFVLKYYTNRDLIGRAHEQNESLASQSQEKKASQVVQLLVYVLAAMTIISNLNIDFTLFSLKFGSDESVSIHLNNILSAILIILIARLLVWFSSNVFLYTLFNKNEIDEGSRFAITQIVKYIVYVFAILIALRSLGIDMTLIMGGAAALLVGIGLGLQQTFNDFFSGIVLLFERSVAVGDILYIDHKAATVKKIGLRSSIIETADGISNIVPNSRLVNDLVQNWTHFDPNVRFSLTVGVAYGSDTELVKKLLLEAALNNKFVLKNAKPFVRFQDFGDSALIFELFYWSRKYLANEDVKSDLRFDIDRLFRANNITIPFPQRDLWIKQNVKE